jgi:cytochrome c-type biogenesis protein CcmH/NrfF
MRHSLKEDLYLVLNGFDPQVGVVSLKIVINPLVNWIWFGFALLTFGTAIAFAPERAYQLAEKATRAPGAAAGVGGTAALLLVLLLSSLARAAEPVPRHEEGKTVPAAPRTPEESELFHKIVCMCGTCGRQILSDCTCGFAARQREEISRMLADGKTKDQVIAYYLSKYPGESALAMPIDRGFNRLAWALPYAAFFIGAGVLVVAARRMTRRPSSPGAEPASAPGGSLADHALVSPEREPSGDGDYEARLDDELDDLD